MKAGAWMLGGHVLRLPPFVGNTGSAPSVAALLSAFCAVGCSGADESALFTPPTASPVPRDSGTVPTDSSSTPPTGSSDAADTSDAKATADVDTKDTATTPPVVDSSTPPADTGPTTTPDTGTPPTNLGIHCGTAFCTPGTEVCCRTNAQGTGDVCKAVALCPVAITSVPIACDDAADCEKSGHAGQICCDSVQSSGGNRSSQVSCHDASDCTGIAAPLSGEILYPLCDTTLPVSQACPNAASSVTCTERTVLRGYPICR